MNAASLAEIKRGLKDAHPETLIEVCLRLAKFKKENKELLTYLLFESADETAYRQSAIDELDEYLQQLPTGHIYYTKKGLRKILRRMNRLLTYSSDERTDVEVRLHFCEQLTRKLKLSSGSWPHKLYEAQRKKISVMLDKMDPDIRFDYQSRVESLTL